LSKSGPSPQFATINQLSNTLRKGELGAAKAPLVLGNEGSGIVEESGQFKPGARVAIYGGSELGFTHDGLFQQWALVEDKRLLKLPDALNWDEGAALTVNYLTAYRALTKAAKLQKGQKVVISGATGSVGHALVQFSKALGGHPLALVSSSEKARRAREAGAPSVIDLSSQNLTDAVRDLTNGQGADWAFDPVGGPTLGQLLRSVRRYGRVVSVGFTGGKEPAFDVVDLIVNEKSVVGYSLHAETDNEISKALVEMMTHAAKGNLRPVIDSTVPLEDFELGYSRLVSRKAVGSVVLHLH
jgi:NADPH2:quinone reductase